MTTLTSMNGEHAIVFCVADREKRKYGYTWLIEWNTTSFYIKAQFKPLQIFKVSIHGPDPRHPGKHGYRLDFEHDDEKEKAIKAGGGWLLDGGQVPAYFTGRRINPTTVHLARFATSWDMFTSQILSAPMPQVKQKATLHAALEAPRLLRSAFVDIYLSDHKPYWPSERIVRASDAGMGPISNGAGMHLTAVDRRQYVTDEPDPFGRSLDRGVPIDQCVRGIAEKVDSTGLLWICEKMMPKNRMGQT